MKLKHELMKFDSENPFGNCKLDRKKYAPALTNMLETFPEGFVMAIDNEWGTGKTTFVQMWQASIAKDYKTIYFNAWENDFDNDVLAALMGELGTLNDRKTKTAFKNLVRKGAVLSKNTLPILIEAVANKYIGEGVVNKVASELAKSSGEIMIEQVTEYTNKKNGLVEFRDSLAKYIEETKGGKPVVFIIDELDRCRPDYAVEVLEKVKHFFSVKGIVFVLSINKNELKNAIHGVYNSAKINADDYLRRFIDIEYSIPEPNKQLFCDYLYSYYEFEELPSSNYGNKDFLGLAYILFTISNTTLRQQEKIFAYTRIVFGNITSNMLEDLNAVVFSLIYEVV
jgi:predicted KAP-like P-loop ATPase